MTTQPNTRDREMILHPLRWPQLVLPLIRRGHGTAAVFAPPLAVREISESAPIKLYLGNMFMDWPTAPTKTYPNVDALLADGWRVD